MPACWCRIPWYVLRYGVKIKSVHVRGWMSAMLETKHGSLFKPGLREVVGHKTFHVIFAALVGILSRCNRKYKNIIDLITNVKAVVWCTSTVEALSNRGWRFRIRCFLEWVCCRHGARNTPDPIVAVISPKIHFVFSPDLLTQNTWKLHFLLFFQLLHYLDQHLKSWMFHLETW